MNHTHPNSMYIPLSIPSKMHELAKGLGAQCDGDDWSVPKGIDPFPFYRWLRGGKHVNLRAREYWIAHVSIECPHCEVATPVIGFVLPIGHEELEVAESGEHTHWVKQDNFCFLSQISYLLPPVYDQLKPIYHWYQPRMVAERKVIRYLNCCIACHQFIDDLDLTAEPGQAFMPLDERGAHSIQLHFVKGSFMAAAHEWTEDLPWIEEKLVYANPKS